MSDALAPPSDEELEQLLREREEREREEVLSALRGTEPGAPCPVCAAPLRAQALLGALTPFVRRPPLRCASCGLTVQAPPNALGWGMAMVVAAALAAGGMSAIFSAQRMADPGSQKLAFLGGALLFGGGLFLGYGVHGAGNLRLLEARALGMRRRRRAEDEASERANAPGDHPVEHHGGWFQENLEAVVVAVILALIIRHFAMEAFVIPTGSMAPTLYGDHFELGCPSCGYEFAVSKHEGEFARDADTLVEADCPLCGEGFTRELTPGDVHGGHKILVNKFSYDARPPERFEIAVFKYPEAPWKNYIKRLVGLPGETLEIRNGDLFVDGSVARKPDHVLDSIWIPVHDSSLVPSDRRRFWEPREGAAAWAQLEGGGLEARPPGREPVWAAFTRGIHDTYGYNRYAGGGSQHSVADLRVRAQVVPEAGATVRLAILESDRQVTARFETARANGKATFAVEVDGAVQERVEAPGLVPGRSVELTLAYADDRARLLIDGAPVLTWIDPFAPEDTYTSNVRVGASGAPTRFTRLRIDRDVYYLARRNSKYGLSQPLTLPKDAYFAMGDNSPNSEDGRAWGVVREGHLIGRAFLVFWPLGEVQRIR